jgi:hypothetical protein
MKIDERMRCLATTAVTVQLVLAAAQPIHAADTDPVIDAARHSAIAFSTSLPDYIVKRTTTRSLGGPLATATNWRNLDVVAADVAFEHGTEVYTNISINGKAAKALPASGIWSVGEFSTMLLDVLSPERTAVFTNRRASTIRKKRSWRYDFAVDQKHSAWRVAAEPTTRNPAARPSLVEYSPAFTGVIWIDRDGGQVLRIERYARDLPSTFPFTAISQIADYEFVKIGESSYLLPTYSESVTCVTNENAGPPRPLQVNQTNVCFRNQTVFRGYDKFGADATIVFDTEFK